MLPHIGFDTAAAAADSIVSGRNPLTADASIGACFASAMPADDAETASEETQPAPFAPMLDLHSDMVVDSQYIPQLQLTGNAADSDDIEHHA